MGLLKAARELGLRVPQDLAVVGFDDLDMADYIGWRRSGRICVKQVELQLNCCFRAHGRPFPAFTACTPYHYP